MSSVLSRFRSESSLEFYTTAREMDKVFYSQFGRWPYTKKEMKKRGIFDFG
jgi:hypothetical protein